LYAILIIKKAIEKPMIAILVKERKIKKEETIKLKKYTYLFSFR
jgi:hypothetical protein